MKIILHNQSHWCYTCLVHVPLVGTCICTCYIHVHVYVNACAYTKKMYRPCVTFCMTMHAQFPAVASLCGVALSTITVYVEWIGWGDLLSHDCKLLRLLYSFISVEQLKTGACECLLAILSRKVCPCVHIVYMCSICVDTHMYIVFSPRQSRGGNY